MADMAWSWALLVLWIAVVWGALNWKGIFRGAAGSWRRKARADAGKHFIAGAQLLARARQLAEQGRNKKKSEALARDAAAQCDMAISLDPRDAAAHIVKALALEHLGNTNAALRSLTLALSPPAAKSLTDSQKADALLKRAAMNLNSGRGRRSCRAAIADAEAALALNSLDAPDAAYRLLSGCYERLGMKEEAGIWLGRCRGG